MLSLYNGFHHCQSHHTQPLTHSFSHFYSTVSSLPSPFFSLHLIHHSISFFSHLFSPSSLFSTMHSLNHLSSRTSTPPLLMPSSSASPALSPHPLGKTLHPHHHSNDSNAVALAALSANWGNYNLAAAGVPFLPFLLLPGSSSLSLSLSFHPLPSPFFHPSIFLFFYPPPNSALVFLSLVAYPAL